MIRAFVLIDVAAEMPDSVCRAVRDSDDVLEAHVVAGDFDVIADLEGDDPHDVLTTVTSDIRPLEGVGTTRTYICLD
ncbi:MULTISPECIES: Lrp/AsnC family transcriptional regulator [Natronorubrum]|uniref:AsnC family transcriptional regulator n=2 Tax=Natronorubrum TaxID=134813 RepID=A0A1P8RFR5_9EURY|nr:MULTISPECIES: Lrp/AsnC ligand binding domain-containing protein [Natronorubrum]APX97470.1 AsnC family transcriptional regulator [Natronorubrum daqingense]SEH17375.1 AsnC family protein [Natronorubrum sediminis]